MNIRKKLYFINILNIIIYKNIISLNYIFVCILYHNNRLRVEKKLLEETKNFVIETYSINRENNAVEALFCFIPVS